jgi:uncharacterized protein
MGTITHGKQQEVLFGKTRWAVLELLLAHPDESFYLRQIERASGVGLGGLQRELKQLTDAEILKRTVSGKQVYYQVNQKSPIFVDLRNLILNIISPANPSHKPEVIKSRARIPVPRDKIADFSRRNHIRKLSLFGSVLRDDFRPDSDVDVLVEFEDGQTPGFGIVDIEQELSGVLGHKVDLRTPQDLSRYFRDQVVRESEVQYDET